MTALKTDRDRIKNWSFTHSLIVDAVKIRRLHDIGSSTKGKIYLQQQWKHWYQWKRWFQEDLQALLRERNQDLQTLKEDRDGKATMLEESNTNIVRIQAERDSAQAS